MYSTCIYCNHNLGANEVIESFPVGRRLAFDQAKGRLWVVCRKCEKWNLTPFEERWEAIEACERLYHDARKRVTTDNIGLAKLNEGLQLVRIGEPLRPEFAAWRYGDQFGRRFRRAVLLGTGAAAVGGGLIVAGAVTGVLSGSGWALWQMSNGLYNAARRRRLVAVVTAPSGQRLTVRGKHVENSQLLPPVAVGEHWGLKLHHEGGEPVSFYGDQARRATALIMPKVNAGGASRAKVDDAVRQIEVVGNPAQFLEEISRRPFGLGARRPERWKGAGWDGRAAGWGGWGGERRSRKSSPKVGLTSLGLETRLAIEMAVNEENERIALEGELAMLELEWKEAEEIAGIADKLGLPQELEDQFEELRRRGGAPSR